MSASSSVNIAELIDRRLMRCLVHEPDQYQPAGKNFARSIRKESLITIEKYAMIISLAATDKDFAQMMQTLTGLRVTQIDVQWDYYL
jgi:hypothetical protein